MACDGGGEVMEMDAFLFRFLDFFFVGRHFIATASIQHVHFLGPLAQAGSGCIHGDIAAADDGHPPAKINALPAVELSQKVAAGKDPRKIFAGNVQLGAAFAYQWR